MASTLYGEILELRQNLARMANNVAARYMRAGFFGKEGFDKHFLESLALPKPKIYPALAVKVGTLDSQLALEIVRFYSRAETADTWLPRLLDDRERPYTYGINYVLDPAIEAVIGVESALRAIEDMAGIGTRAATPSLKDAIGAQEHENIRHDD